MQYIGLEDRHAAMISCLYSRTVIAFSAGLLLALLVQYFYPTDVLSQLQGSSSVCSPTGLPTTQLLVGVLSARHRQQQRDAIRDTWWSQLEAIGARGVFVIGDSDCPLADHCRLDQYACEKWTQPRGVAGDQRTVRLTPGPDRLPAAIGVTFTVLRSVVARAVTVTSHNGTGDVILETADGQVAATAAVTAERKPPADSSDITVPLSPLLVLPAGFLGRLRVRDLGQVSAACGQTGVPAPTELSITALITADGRHVKPGLEPLCCPLALVYTLHEESGTVEDRPGLSGGTAGAPSEDSGSPGGATDANCRRPDTDAVSRALAEEAERHGDIVLVPGPDVYRRLPDKLLDFLRWAATEPSADWVVKCDDDVLLDVPRILQNVPSDTGDGVWWGQFRYNWPVDRYGKWSELVYQAEVYPPFACGTASLLSADVVRWLAHNRQALTRFQGEDVSLGIWLSGHRVRRVPDPAWSCAHGDPGGYSLGQLSPDELRRTWRCLRRTGRLELCGAGRRELPQPN